MIIPFMKVKWLTISLSLLGIAHLFFYIYNEHAGFKQGFDFSGGIKIEFVANKTLNIDGVRKFFDEKKIKADIFLAGKKNSEIIKIEIDSKIDSVFQKEANEKSKEMEKFGFSANSVDYLKYLFIKKFSPKHPEEIKIVNADKVGPTVGNLLRKSSLRLLLITLILITFYVTFRFHLIFAIGATVALIHDLIMTIGFIGYFQIPLSVPVVAALLTILGYSINDTIVIFDRIRENLGNDSIGFEKIIDKSITESLTRTIITSVTTLLSVFAVYAYGGEGLKEMALVLILGIIIGTYSSSFIASPMVVFLNKLSKSKDT